MMMMGIKMINYLNSTNYMFLTVGDNDDADDDNNNYDGEG